MESNLVAEFVSKTGASSLEAHNQLQAKGWDLKQAIQDYLKEGKENSSRHVLTKSDAVDENSYKKLARGISRATDNACVVTRARHELGLDFRENGVCNVDQYFLEAPVYSFTLPDFSIYPDDFREFLERDLIELSCLTSLEQAGRLNWWAHLKLCQRLWPLSTTGDGNCLLHAASLGMWGFHDRLLILRKSLHEFLTTSSCRNALWRRWRWQLTLLNAEAGLVYTEEEWEREWEAIVSMASSTPRNSGRRRSMMLDKSGVPENATYESLEEIHVLALAHVLKRTIIVIADTMLKDVNGENLAPILFGGIYLPLEIPHGKCHRSPLVLSYDAAHFSALVTMNSVQHADKPPIPPAVIPLTDSEHKLLPVQFVVDPGSEFVWGRDELVPGVCERLQPNQKALLGLLREYLDVILVPLSSSPSSDEYDDMDTPGDEEEIEKRFSEADAGYDGEDQVDSAVMFTNNRSRAARQLQTVARSFGSIGKSMSKKLKKNLGTITKITKGGDKRERVTGADGVGKPDYLIAARLGGDNRPNYHEEMVRNYLNTAQARFEREQAGKGRVGDTSAEMERLQVQAKMEGSKPCITPGCTMYASVLTSYLCSACYEKQRQRELDNSINSPVMSRHTASQGYGMGKSTFYVDPTLTGTGGTSVSSSNVTLRAKPAEEPPPLQINRSTFYSDRLYPRDWSSSSAGRSTISVFPPKDLPLRRSTLQEVGNAIDGLGPGRYTPAHRVPSNLSDHSSWDHENGSQRKIHSYNLSREVSKSNKTDGTVYCVKGTSLKANPQSRMSPLNSTLTTMSPQTSQDLPNIENVHPPSAEGERRLTAERPVTRIIPVTVEGTVRSMGGKPDRRNCLNVTCPFYGSPELENYCSQCFKGRREGLAQTRSTH